jgi:hypothetical protein
VRHIARVCGGLLLVLGALALVEALRLRDDWQGAKLMPAVVGLVLIALGLFHLIAPPGGVMEWPESRARRRVALMFLTLVAYVAALTPLGFLPATGLFVLVVVRALAAYSWPVTVVVSVTTALVSHVVFKHWLGMPLPSGGFW